MTLYNSVTELIGNTPLLRLSRLEKARDISAHIYAKLEMFNPAGSVKDRAALFMIRDAAPLSSPPRATPASGLPWRPGYTGSGLS